jgi:DNA polymerase III subunit beta
MPDIPGIHRPYDDYLYVFSTDITLQEGWRPARAAAPEKNRRGPVKIVLERDVLADAVAWTARALPARPAVPVLAGIRLQAGADLVLSSFDYDVSAQATVPVSTEEAGSALVSGRLLAEISRSLPAKPVHITAEEGRAVLTCGSATFTLLTMPEDEYPALPEMPPAAGSIGSDAFATAVSQSATAAGRDDTLPALTGVRIEIAGDMLTLVSTDRYRLAVRELRWNPARPDLSAAVLVPAKALTETARSLTSGAEVSIALALPGEERGGDGMIGFEGAGRQTTTRLLGGEFPRVNALLPTTSNAAAVMSTALLAESVKRVSLVAERNTAVRLAFSAGQLVLEAGTGDEAQAEEIIDAEFEGEDLSIAFNPQYLLDGLAAIDSDTVRISFTEPGKPALLTGKPGPDGTPEFRYLLMPIRLGG